MLTPENVQMHSQGAAFLLVWAANMIKLYAATKWLSDELELSGKQPYTNLSPGYKKKDLQKITLQTKLDLREMRRKDNDEMASKRKVRDAGD